MTLRALLVRVAEQEDVNFLLTNRIPRRWLTLFMGWFSRIEHPWVYRASMRVWRLFTDLDLRDAKTTEFRSLHECFIRELRPDARPIDADSRTVTSPCDAIVGACGRITDGMALQAKGFPYSLLELLGDERLVRHYENGHYVTLRLTAGMYHRFHAPYDCRVRQVTYFSGDTWNVNPIALQRVERLFCRNERAAIRCELASGQLLTLVPVAAILLGSIRLQFINVLLHLRYRGPNDIHCDARLGKGDEMGWFQHGSTIIVLAPHDLLPCDSLAAGMRIRMGQPLFRLP